MPKNLHTVLPGGDKIAYPMSAEDQALEGGDVDGKTSQAELNVSKMIDWCLGLKLDPFQDALISQAFSHLGHFERSLNQLLSFIKKTPLFLDIEMKKTQHQQNPEVELAIWASGAAKKKAWHGWDNSLPMPAIVVSGHIWTWYLFVEIGGDLIMLGPQTMGNTIDSLGVWQIIYRLNVLMTWGNSVYRKWFNDHILTWAQRLVNGDIDSEEKAKDLVNTTEGLRFDDTTSTNTAK
ncbi:MAG: hypothetical protein Q9196_006504 [Gyalolechia fulgens]